jgi:hypothetical protein
LILWSIVSDQNIGRRIDGSLGIMRSFLSVSISRYRALQRLFKPIYDHCPLSDFHIVECLFKEVFSKSRKSIVSCMETFILYSLVLHRLDHECKNILIFG